MGELEKGSKKRSKKAHIQRAILGTLFALGGLSIAMVAPKMTRVLARLEPEFIKRKFGKYSFNRSWRSLKGEGFICFEKTDRGTFARLTPKGEAKLRQLELRDYKLPKPKRWDEKWRMLVFDIKEKKKGTREKLRLTLRRIGFLRLQNSVWVYPYDCEDLVMLLKADYHLGREVLYVIADSIENDEHLRREFNLQAKVRVY